VAAETGVMGMGIGFQSDDGRNQSDPIGQDLWRGWLRVTDRRGYGLGIDGSGGGGGGSICYEPMRRNGLVVWIQRRLIVNTPMCSINIIYREREVMADCNFSSTKSINQSFYLF
jgi:hypothetical protein